MSQNKSAFRYTVEYIRTGQPAPYADHEDVYHITIELRAWRPGSGYDKEFSLTDYDEKSVIPHIKKFCHWKENPGTSIEDYFAPHLKHIKQIEPGKWEVFITTRFTD